MAIMAAVQTEVPELWAGTRTDTSTQEHPFGNMTSFGKWDRMDGQHGLQNTIKLALDTKIPQLVEQMENQSVSTFHFRQVILALLHDAHRFWIALAHEISDIYQTILVQTYGSRSHSTEEKSQVWRVTTTFLDVYTTLIARARYCARGVTPDMDPQEANALMLWAVYSPTEFTSSFRPGFGSTLWCIRRFSFGCLKRRPVDMR